MYRSKSTHALLQFHDLYIRLVAQSVNLSPKHGYATTDLNETELNAVIIGADKQNLLSLVEVGDVSLLVESTPEVTRACSVAGSPTDEAEAHMVAVDTFGSNVEG